MNLITYYSRTGNTKKIAEQIKKILKSDIDEIIDLKSRKGILGFITGGFSAALRRQTKIKYNKTPEKYKTLIIGTPVWAGNMTPAIRTYLIQNKSKIKNTAFFCTCGGQQNKTFNELAKLTKKPLAVLEIKDKKINTEETQNKIKQFCRKVK